MKKISHLRWWIAGLLAAATAINYLDRQSLPVVIGEMHKSIPISDQQFSHLQFFFLLAYGTMNAVGGKIVDRLGTRVGYALMIVWWSTASIVQGTVHSVMGLAIARFLLGLGEGGGFPSSAKAVSEWFPAKERSFAFGIFNTGSSIGALIAPPLIAAIVLTLNWRWVFFITGGLGILWAFGWLAFYNTPAQHNRITHEEAHYIESELVLFSSSAKSISWFSLFRYRQIWGLVLAKFFSDSGWYFFIFWLPKYLGDVRHLDIRHIGYYAWIPYAAAGVGSFIGGWFSSYLVRRHWSIDASRKLALGLSAACMPASLLITQSPLGLAICFFSMAMFGHQFWSTTAQTLSADMFPSELVGSVAGLSNAAGAFGSMLFNLLVGILLGWQHSYAIVFVIAGLLHPISFLLILLLVRHIRPPTIASTGA